MKSKILAVVLLVFVFFAFSTAELSSISTEDSVGLLELKNRTYRVDYEPAPAKFDTEGLQEIENYLDQLEQKFSRAASQMREQKLPDIAEYFCDKGMLTGLDGKIYLGCNEVWPYLKSLSKEVTDISFTINYVYVNEFPKKNDEDNIWHVVTVIFSYSCVVDGKPVDPPGGFWGRHVEGCTWQH